MRLYISGPMTDMPNHNYLAFNEAAKQLREAGYEVLNPAELDLIEKKETWEECLRRDIKYEVECDGLALIFGWSESKGASLEKYIADQLGMPVATVEKFIKEKDRYLWKEPVQ